MFYTLLKQMFEEANIGFQSYLRKNYGTLLMEQ